MIATQQQVYIYRCEHKKGTYLYLPEKDNFEAIPTSLSTLLGELTYSFEFNLSKDRKLMHTEAAMVLLSIMEKGYFLQLDPSKLDANKANELGF